MGKADYILFGHARLPADQAITTRFPMKNRESSNKPFYPSCNL
jgi:hypothetical protein